MVSKTKCPACKRAKQLFNELYTELGVFPTIVELDQYDTDLRRKIVDYLQTKTGIRTVPQIFFQGTFVGGNDDVQRLRRQRSLINKYNAAKGQTVTAAALALSPMKSANIIRMSPVFVTTGLNRIRTQPVMFEPQRIQHYMANQFEVKKIQDSMETFSLAPSLPTPSTSGTFTSNIISRPEHKEEEITWMPPAPLPRTRLQRAHSQPVLPYKSRYTTDPPNQYPVIEETPETVLPKTDLIEEVIEEPLPRAPNSARAPFTTSRLQLQKAFSAPIVEEVVIADPYNLVETDAGETGTDLEYTPTLMAFENPNNPSQFADDIDEEVVEEILQDPKFVQSF